MSLSYSHLLIPVSAEYRPEPDAVASFAGGLIDNGNVADGITINFSRVTKGEPRVRQMPDPMTGDTIEVQGPSRSIERPQQLSNAAEIVVRAADEREYDVSIAAEGVPSTAPLTVGYFEGDDWKTMDSTYYLEIRCRVRGNPVRINMLENENDLHAPPDLANYRPRFDEDSLPHERDGLFVHPEAGAINIPNAGTGTFWIEFNYGNFIFPRLRDHGVNVLDESVVNLARNVFDSEFVQACNWG
jgi:hypothetical protein